MWGYKVGLQLCTANHFRKNLQLYSKAFSSIIECIWWKTGNTLQGDFRSFKTDLEVLLEEKDAFRNTWRFCCSLGILHNQLLSVFSPLIYRYVEPFCNPSPDWYFCTRPMIKYNHVQTLLWVYSSASFSLKKILEHLKFIYREADPS